MRDWDPFFFGLAREYAAWSKDNSTKVGAIIVGPAKQVISGGFNGMPRGVNDDVPARLERPEKYKWFAHAEENAIFNAARHGISTDGCILYCTLMPCATCTRGIIQAGIRQVVVPRSGYRPPEFERWKADWDVAETMLQEAGVKLRIS